MPSRQKIQQWLRVGLAGATFSLSLCPASALAADTPAQTPAANATDGAGGWKSFITAAELQAWRNDPRLLIIDARAAEEYAEGHIPGAINLPGTLWRSPATNPAKEGVGQYIFRHPDGSVDSERYEKFLSATGVRNDHKIVVYGSHAGKADGSVPATLLLKLGHEEAYFLDGIGIDQWQSAGFVLTKDPVTLPPSTYTVHAVNDRLWSYERVLKNLNNPDVVFVDSRSESEYTGLNLRDNQRGGHIPGAKLLNYEGFLDRVTRKTISYADAKAKVEALNIPKDKTVVIYCQTGTRCSLKELIFRDLGYKKVALYDASWQEWGNRADAPIEKAEETPK